MVCLAPGKIKLKKNGTSTADQRHAFAYVRAYEINVTLVLRMSHPKKLTYEEMYVT